MKYYSTQRPVAPGTFPKPDGNEVLEIVNFDKRQYCEEADDTIAPSSTGGDYSPANPWDAPGMSVSDFI